MSTQNLYTVSTKSRRDFLFERGYFGVHVRKCCMPVQATATPFGTDTQNNSTTAAVTSVSCYNTPPLLSNYLIVDGSSSALFYGTFVTTTLNITSVSTCIPAAIPAIRKKKVYSNIREIIDTLAIVYKFKVDNEDELNPNVEVIFPSTLLNHCSIFQAFNIAVETLLKCGYKPSCHEMQRLDLHIDLVDIDVATIKKQFHDNRGRIVLEGNTDESSRPDEVYKNNGLRWKQDGYNLVIYDKRLELEGKAFRSEKAKHVYYSKQQKQDSYVDRIGADLWNTDCPITRFEFQLKREFLKREGILTIDQVKIKLPAVVKKLTERCILIKSRKAVKHAVHPLWKIVQRYFQEAALEAVANAGISKPLPAPAQLPYDPFPTIKGQVRRYILDRTAEPPSEFVLDLIIAVLQDAIEAFYQSEDNPVNGIDGIIDGVIDQVLKQCKNLEQAL